MQTHVIKMPAKAASRVVPILPETFGELQPYVSVWALETETQRNIQRHAIPMEDIEEFGAAMLARVDEVVAYLNDFADAPPPDATALMQMLLSLAEVAPAIEFYQQQAVIDGYDPRRFVANETFVLRPSW